MKILIAFSLAVLLTGCQEEKLDISAKTLAFTKEVVQRELNYIIRSTEKNYEDKWTCEHIANESHHFEIVKALKTSSNLYEHADKNIDSFNSILSQFRIIDSLILLDAQYLGLSEDNAKELLKQPSITALNENNGDEAMLSRIKHTYENFINIASRGLYANHVGCFEVPFYYALLNLKKHENIDSTYISVGINQSICPPLKAELVIDGLNPVLLNNYSNTKILVHKDFVRKEEILWTIKITNTIHGRVYTQKGRWNPDVYWF
jgi:hypothetical protein